MSRILGIEGGGTKTDWIYQPGRGAPLQQGKLPGANLRLVSDETLLQILGQLPAEAEQVGVFLAGCVNDADRERLKQLARQVWPHAALVVGSDRQSGFAAAFGPGDGITVIAGTGSAITGRRDGQVEKAGGWGHLLGDKGSGYDLALQALRNVLWSYDLTRQIASPAVYILAELGLNHLSELVNWAKDADKMSVARLAPVVFRAAAEGDADMQAIIHAGAYALADGAVAVARRLGLDAPEIRLQGGLFEHGDGYVIPFTRRIHELLPEANVAVCDRSGVEGAFWLASQAVAEEKVEAAPAEKPPEVNHEELAVALTEQINPRSDRLGEMSVEEMVDLFVTEERRVEEALAAAKEALAAGVRLVSGALAKGGRLFYVGAGTSGRLGVLDASEIPPTFGVDRQMVQGIMAGGVVALYASVEGAEDDPRGGALAVEQRGVRAGDVVCGIAASGRTPFVLGALTRARELGAATILLTCNPLRKRPADAAPWDVEIDLAPGPELLAGSTRLKAGTATKCALNILTTLSMVLLGKTRGNLMASVQVSNLKLRDRAIRLVCRAKGVSREEAEALLAANGWKVGRVLGS